MKKLNAIPFLVFLILLLNIFMISAQIQTLGTFQAGDNINLTQICGTCTFNKIETVNTPERIIPIHSLMTKNGTFYNFTFDGLNTKVLGEYIVNGVGDLNTINTSWTYNFHITTFGNTLDLPRAILYLILLSGSIFLFLLCLWGAIVLPFRNKRNELSQIYGIEKLKYFKLLFIFLCFPLLIWIVNLLFSISNNFELLVQYNAFIKMVFVILMNISFPIYFIMMATFLFVAWKDLELQKLLNRGMKPI